ncbi:MAG: zinc-dependent metalloprotease [Acidimicrobiia bacterium]
MTETTTGTMSWALVTRVAARFAGTYPLEGTYHEKRLADQAPDLVRRASELVTAETGLVTPGQPEVAVVSRAAWAEANVSSMATLIAPAQKRLGAQKGIGSSVADRVVALELGTVLGLLSRRVLGQYELVLPTADGSPGDTVMLVGANLLAMERQHEFRPDEFRFWVALHECTHRAQFIGVPWLREYFLSLVNELVDSAIPEPGRLARIAAEVRRASASGEPLIDDTGLFGLFASAEQRRVIDKVQALMSLLEGHGHFVMDRIGGRMLLTQRRMSAVLRVRRQDPRTARFLRLIGLDMKLKQYDAGAAFIKAVERHTDFGTLDRAWEAPEMLPTLEEIEEPVRWLARVA